MTPGEADTSQLGRNPDRRTRLQGLLCCIRHLGSSHSVLRRAGILPLPAHQFNKRSHLRAISLIKPLRKSQMRGARGKRDAKHP